MTKLSMSEEEILKRKYTRPYEKRIKELERKLEQAEKDLTDYQFNYPKIKELEKENAELKERVKTLTIHDTNAVLSGLEMKVLKESHRDRANKTQELLTKAKEMIRKCIEHLDRTNYFHYEIITEAEQFLKEIKENDF